MVSWGGLLGIFVSVGMYDERVPFPGVATLLPTLGTVAFIWANQALTTTGRVLSWSPIVFIGKVSYSFYLIHWPVIAYADYWFRDEMPWTVRLCLMDGAFLLAVFSYYFVETPFRKGQILSLRRPLFVSALGFTVLLMAVGFLVHQSGGIRSRFDGQMLAHIPPARERVDAASQVSLQEVESGKFLEFGDPTSEVTCLAWGDSHAMALMPVLDDLCAENAIHGVSTMYSNTPPLLEFVNRPNFGQGGNTPRFNAAVMKLAIERGVQMVVMAANWAQYADDPQFEHCLNETVNQLTAVGIKVVILRDVPMHTGYVPRQLVRASYLGQDVHSVGVPVAEHREKNRRADQWLKAMAGPQVIVVDPTPYMVDEAGLCRAEWDGVAQYRDGGHVSAAGARRLKPMLSAVFQNLGPAGTPSHPDFMMGERPQEQLR